MKLIAHRGLINGPDVQLENEPDHVVAMLAAGYDCEVDVWLKDDQWFLGHDSAAYPILHAYLFQPGLWLHCKNAEALHALGRTKLNYFWHDTDQFTLTSHRWVWTFPGGPLTDRSVCVLPEWDDSSLESTKTMNCYGICSDHIKRIEAFRAH